MQPSPINQEYAVYEAVIDCIISPAAKHIFADAKVSCLRTSLRSSQKWRDDIQLVVLDEFTSWDILDRRESRSEEFRKRGYQSAYQTFSDVDGNLSIELEACFSDFLVKNNVVYKLLHQFSNSSIQYAFISQNEVDQIFREKAGWDLFYKKYPASQGMLTFSRVGFNASETHALVFVGNQSHWLHGAQVYFWLLKDNGLWKIYRECCVAIS